MQKRNIYRILPFGVIWAIFGLLYVFLEYGIMGNAKVYPSTGNIYSFQVALISVPIGSFIMGILYGSIEILFLNYRLRRQSFWKKIFIKAFLYILFISALSIILSFLASSRRHNLPVFHPEVVQTMIKYVTNFAFISILIYASVVTILSLFILEVSDYLGGGIFNNFFIGKYHQPLEEARIFMFLDMKSSTTIAEQLGNQKFFKLLNQYYADTTKAIISTEGEVYQYAGDEVIVSWSMDRGLDKHNCIRCFFEIKQQFQNHAEQYISTFGLVPEFKAGIHCGQVTTGEIGVLKKDIFFTGDVLNTAARIQATCNALDTDILISEDLLSALQPLRDYAAEPKGEHLLKGRLAPVKLFSLSPHA